MNNNTKVHTAHCTTITLRPGHNAMLIVSFDAIPDEHTIGYLFPPSQPFMQKEKILCLIIELPCQAMLYLLYFYRQRISVVDCEGPFKGWPPVPKNRIEPVP